MKKLLGRRSVSAALALTPMGVAQVRDACGNPC